MLCNFSPKMMCLFLGFVAKRDDYHFQHTQWWCAGLFKLRKNPCWYKQSCSLQDYIKTLTKGFVCFVPWSKMGCSWGGNPPPSLREMNSVYDVVSSQIEGMESHIWNSLLWFNTTANQRDLIQRNLRITVWLIWFTLKPKHHLLF